jgi:hypothetical protein
MTDEPMNLETATGQNVPLSDGLDRAVYDCETKLWQQYEAADYDQRLKRPCDRVIDYHYGDDWTPTTDWAQGGPIIERELIQIEPVFGGDWVANNANGDYWRGETPLVAAMKCYVGTTVSNAELTGRGPES